MMKYFNIAGPCNRNNHYMIDAEARLNEVRRLIDRNQYFVIHAARQSGKTTCLLDLARRLNAEGQYCTLYCSLENVQQTNDQEKGIPAVVRSIKNAVKYAALPDANMFAANADYADYANILQASLTEYCLSLDKPLVILFDEADCLQESTMITFLRQLRNGYNSRSIAPFVHSIALAGLRNIRDYKTKIRPDSESTGGASPFNIITESLTLKNFTKEEIIRLYAQHTAATGQIFEDAAIELIYRQTQGQPWLVNAIARDVIEKQLQSDYAQPVTARSVKEAIKNIILVRPVHIDNLLERLNEPRVRRIIEPMMLGDDNIDRESDDFLYTCDLGLIRTDSSVVMPANPIYAEVIVRKLSSNTQSALENPKYPYQTPRYIKNGRIDMDSLMRDFQLFWRENSDVWTELYEYREAAPHLIMMAFLQRIANGGGQIIREMASGRGRLDLCLIYDGHKYPIELKLRKGDKYLAEGIEQTVRYMDIHSCDEGWLVVFDRRPNVAWNDKIYLRKEVVNGKTVTVIGA